MQSSTESNKKDDELFKGFQNSLLEIKDIQNKIRTLIYNTLNIKKILSRNIVIGKKLISEFSLIIDCLGILCKSIRKFTIEDQNEIIEKLRISRVPDKYLYEQVIDYGNKACVYIQAEIYKEEDFSNYDYLKGIIEIIKSFKLHLIQCTKVFNNLKSEISIGNEVGQKDEKEIDNSHSKNNIVFNIMEKQCNFVNFIEINENGLSNPNFEIQVLQFLGILAKPFFSDKNGKRSLYIYLLDNITGTIIQEKNILEFTIQYGNSPRCKWIVNTKRNKIQLSIFTKEYHYGFILELDQNTRMFKENYERFEIENNGNNQMEYSAKNNCSVIVHALNNGITVIDHEINLKRENVTGSYNVICGIFFDEDNFIYPDSKSKIFVYNLRTRKQKCVSRYKQSYNEIWVISLSHHSNKLILGDEKSNIIIYDISLQRRKFAVLLKIISSEISSWMLQMHFLSFEKLMVIINSQNEFRIINIRTGNIQKSEILKGRLLKIWDFKIDEVNGVFIIFTTFHLMTVSNTLSQIYFFK